MKDQKELGRLFYKQLQRIVEAPANTTLPDRLYAQYHLLQQLFVVKTQDEKLHFTTLFARMAYVLQQSQADARLTSAIHGFRKLCRQYTEPNFPKERIPVEALSQGTQVLALTISHLFQLPIPELFHPALRLPLPAWQSERRVHQYLPSLRVVALRIDREQECLIALQEENPEINWHIHYNVADRNENFNPTIQTLGTVFQFPVTLQLLEVEVSNPHHLYPRGIILEPDYLVDVSAIAECFKPTGPDPRLFLLKKFTPFQTSIPLMLGNIANFFLDRLLTDPDQTFKGLFPEVFRLNPLAFSLLKNQEIREIMQKAQLHFVNLKRVILQELPALELQRDEALVEPTFYSDQHGLLGRLDVLFKGSQKTGIIELKSGKSYRPNIYGLNNNHFIQTLLYDLLVRAVFGEQTDPINYILYSGVTEKHLRFAPRIKAQQLEALQIRNQLVALEFQLANTYANDPEQPLLQSPAAFLLRHLHPDRFQNLSHYERADLESFAQTFHQLSETEQKYFLAFAGFTAREHLLAKIGNQGIEQNKGQSGLWLHLHAEKEENFQILTRLQLNQLTTEQNDQFLHFKRHPEYTNPLANFRKGDIAILYPFIPKVTSPLSNQLLKCTITEIDPQQVIVRLRNPQTNPELFQIFEEWNLEPDHLDGNFTSMYRSLFAFAQAPRHKRVLLLGQQPPSADPEFHQAAELPVPDLTSEQATILQKMVHAKDYFLLWGPPGTGKTSVMLKSYIRWVLENTEENLLLLAYTNRAVDEICGAIHELGPLATETYIRVGSTFSTSAPYQPYLLNEKIKKAETRKEIVQILEQHRLFVATVASFTGKQELVQLKKFRRVVIDEASQILEPVLVGLLPQFEQFILIGDHKQLPAVVVQAPELSTVKDSDLAQIGLHNLRNSLFERLYKKCLEANWTWAFARLSHQGRMHQEIMDFPNQHFYENFLDILPSEIPVSETQRLPISWHWTTEGAYESMLCHRRFLFIETPVDSSSSNGKTNLHEARELVRLIEAFRCVCQENGEVFELNQIGIITPYRAQIAQIQAALESAGIDWQQLTIDTVERYQGGARDIILISLCTNTVLQLASLVSASDEGVDRKLNVALTRARRHLVILGNPEILRHNPTYQALMEYGAIYASED